MFRERERAVCEVWTRPSCLSSPLYPLVKSGPGDLLWCAFCPATAVAYDLLGPLREDLGKTTTTTQTKQNRGEQWDGQAQVGPGASLVLHRCRPPFVVPDGAGAGGQTQERRWRLWTWRETSPPMFEACGPRPPAGGEIGAQFSQENL